MGRAVAEDLNMENANHMTTHQSDLDPEIVAISAVYAALKALDPEAEARVLDYVPRKLSVPLHLKHEERIPRGRHGEEALEVVASEVERDNGEGAEEELEGVSPAAKKWMIRNSLRPEQLSVIFSLGVDEIDLVAKAVPGDSKRERMRSVFLLKGIAAYIGTPTSK